MRVFFSPAVNNIDNNKWNNRGIAKLNLGRYAEAVVDFNQVIRLEPYNGRPWYLCGKAKDEYGNLDGAVVDYEKAISLGYVAPSSGK